MGFNPARHVAVVALANAATGDGIDDIGRHVLDPAQPVNLKIPSVHHQISLPATALSRFVGTYQASDGYKIPIERGAMGLLVGSGTSQFAIYPETPTRFFAKVADLQFDFDGAGSGAPAFMVLHQDGESFTFKRTP